MDNLKMHTPDLAAENFRKLAALFPNAVTETIDENGDVVRAIDADVLRQEIATHVVEGRAERYQFTWPGKRQAILTANAPISKTLRPCIEESVGRDGKPGGFNSENLYIEGDNLEVLKLLRETYLGKIKMIYIDPPYNTGSDFVYEDDFAESIDEYIGHSGQYDEYGDRLVTNLESNGRFHTDWLNMIYSRLKLARDLLSDDGAIFISIDDNEAAQLRKICDEIFGERNFVAEFAWEKKKKPSFLHKNVGKLNDYILCYVKNTIMSQPFSVETTTEGKKYPLNNAGNTLAILTFPAGYVKFNMPDGTISPQDMSEGAIITRLLDTVHIVNGHNSESFRLEGEWRYSQKKLNEIISNSEGIVISKIPFRPNHIKSGGEIKKMKNILSPFHYQMETNEDATRQLVDLFGVDLFDNPKPIKLLKYLVKALTYDSKDAIVLDFFSGSATTAHAVMQLNAEDGGHRQFIMVQIPEETPETSEARKAGYENICEIGKERIRRAGAKIREETNADIDYGFRVLKVDSSNMKNIYYTPEDTEQAQLDLLADSIKADRTPEDLLFQVMLDIGVPLSSTIETIEITGHRVFDVGENFLLACFDKNITEEIITEIAKRKPSFFVMRDSSIANDVVAANFEQIFKTYSPRTERRVL